MRRLLLFLALFAIQVGFAQEIRVVDLSNQASIELGETLTRAELIERLGNPQSARESFDDEITMTTILRAHFKDNLFIFSDMALYKFVIYNPFFEVVINNKYRVKVGDHWPTFVVQLESEPVSFEWGEVYLRLYWGESTDYLGFELDSNGIIRDIAWVVPT